MLEKNNIGLWFQQPEFKSLWDLPLGIMKFREFESESEDLWHKCRHMHGRKNSIVRDDSRAEDNLFKKMASDFVQLYSVSRDRPTLLEKFPMLECEELQKMTTKGEVEHAVKGMRLHTAPDPDEFHVFF